MNNSINITNNKIGNATFWSLVSEVMAKLIVPFSNMILARIISPEEFGIIATINMVVSFSEIFATAGFQKYLVQHDYEDKEHLFNGTSVAFWTMMFISICILGFIALFNEPIAKAIGSEGYGSSILIASTALPLLSYSGILEALYQREFNYKVLFYNRIAAIMVPFLVTIPLALIGLGHWALIIGTLSGYMTKAIVLTIKAEWKPNIYFNKSIFKQMLSFSIWSLGESLAMWASSYIDILIISTSLGAYYTGLYKNSQSTVTGILTIITGATTSVLFSALSRTKNDKEKFKDIFNIFQRNVAIFVLPLGVGMFVYSELITRILLGSQWLEASKFVGVWGLCTSLVCVFGTFSREVYRAKGYPKLSLIAQLLHLIFVIPVCYYGVSRGFDILIYIRSFAFLQIIIVHMIIMKIFMKMSPILMFKTTLGPMISSLLMGIVALFIKQFSTGFFADIISIMFLAILYFLTLSLFPSYRIQMKNNANKFFKSNSK